MGDCDVVALRGDEDPVVVELKRVLNLQLVMQAVDRLELTEAVYLGVPASVSVLRTGRKRVLRTLRMLGLGLLTVDVGAGTVEAVLDPSPYRGRRRAPGKQRRLLREFIDRVGDPNRGGLDRRRGRVTAFRQRAWAIARHLEQHGPTRASEVAAAVGDGKARDVLYRNVYGWFERVGHGVYDLSPRGRRALADVAPT